MRGSLWWASPNRSSQAALDQFKGRVLFEDTVPLKNATKEKALVLLKPIDIDKIGLGFMADLVPKRL
ncbi:MAG: hypothetical protein K6T59_12720 [Bryobacteraceae bacterium]|nr:hypothetical protein [Bryobacteraceae bacterium]